MFFVINPEGKALNLEAASTLAPLPPEFVDGPQRMLVTIGNDDYTVYGLSMHDVISAPARGVTHCARRWVKGVPPQMPGRAPRGQGSVTLGSGYTEEEADAIGAHFKEGGQL